MLFEELEQMYYATTMEETLNFILFVTLLFGFIVIVLGSKKYNHWLKKIDKYF